MTVIKCELPTTFSSRAIAISVSSFTTPVMDDGVPASLVAYKHNLNYCHTCPQPSGCIRDNGDVPQLLNSKSA